MDKRILIFALFIVFCTGVPVMAQTWERQNSGTTDDLRGVTFTDSLHGWVVGGGSNGGSFFYTTDGGTTWAPEPQHARSGLTRVSFTSPQSGWAVGPGGLILHTSDGHLWGYQDSSLNSGGLDVAFLDNNTGWTVGDLVNDTSRVLHTTDGGATWMAQPLGPVGILKGVVFVDAEDGWAVGYPGLIMHTTNGGNTWAQQTCTYSGPLFDGAFTDNNTGWLVGYAGAIVHTTNGGTTWTEQTGGNNHYLAAAAFTDSNTGWIVGDGGTILHTVNGGSSWVGQPSGTTQFLSDVTFLNSGMGWAVGNGGTILRYRAPLADVTNHPSVLPGDFYLEPNFPNPFNPGTTLRFGVPQASEVSLEVFDLMGRKVTTLYSGIAQPGVHAVTWTCPGCASGTYLARLRYAGHALHQPMLLIK